MVIKTKEQKFNFLFNIFSVDYMKLCKKKVDGHLRILYENQSISKKFSFHLSLWVEKLYLAVNRKWLDFILTKIFQNIMKCIMNNINNKFILLSIIIYATNWCCLYIFYNVEIRLLAGHGKTRPFLMQNQFLTP